MIASPSRERALGPRFSQDRSQTSIRRALRKAMPPARRIGAPAAGLQPTVARKRLLRIRAKFFHPFTKNVLVDVPRRLSYASASLTHQADRLDLNFRRCIASHRLPTNTRPQCPCKLIDSPCTLCRRSLGRYNRMNVLIKFSIAASLLLATAIAEYLYVVLDDEGFGLARSPPAG
jgi:hypothetical protein